MANIGTELLAENHMNIEVITTPTTKINLATAEDIRREMGRVYREARNNKLPINEATKLTYILTQILRATETFLLEERLSALELTHSGGHK